MTDNRYSSYIASKEWSTKRHQKLYSVGYKCQACGTRKNLHVHHLTYKHLENEPLEDLLVLCEMRHTLTEKLIDSGDIVRTGDPIELAHKTINLLGFEWRDDIPGPEFHRTTNAFNGSSIKIRNPVQAELISDYEFRYLLRIDDRRTFKKMVRQFLRGNKRRGRFLANAFALYDRCH